jgi:hypothetical protein
MSGRHLSDNDHVSRYCSPLTIGKDGLPKVGAFQPRANEDYLSVNWLEYFGSLSTTDAVRRIQEMFVSKGYTLKENGRFAVLNVKDVRNIGREDGRDLLRLEHFPLENDQSHAGIFGYSTDDFMIALDLRALVSLEDVYDAVP